jgi:hypothetical protein
MKRTIPTLILVFSFIQVFAQTEFKKGYFISNSKTTTCLIKDLDWKKNPSEFDYKLSENSEVQKRNKQNTDEFGVDGKFKFVSALVDIDKSTDDIRRIKNKKRPEFETEKLFLRVIVYGEANLYSYTESNLERYFYKLKETRITQLIYKRYILPNRSTSVAENNDYKQWISNNLMCGDLSIDDIEKLNYKEKDLKNYFIIYNKCNSEKPKYVETIEKRKVFNLNIKGGIDYSSAKVVNTQDGGRDMELGNSTDFRYGIEAEFILPFRNNKWSIFLEPSLRSSSTSVSEPRDNLQGGFLNTDFEYKSLELPIGVRHYIFLNKGTQLFLNTAYVLDIRNNDTSVAFSRSDGSDLGGGYRNLRSKSNIFIGAGIRVFNRLSGEIRFYTTRTVLWQFVRYSNAALVVGFRLF